MIMQPQPVLQFGGQSQNARSGMRTLFSQLESKSCKKGKPDANQR
jgi:CII-binding regulator of phage lambda lysogenization HflD